MLMRAQRYKSNLISSSEYDAEGYFSHYSKRDMRRSRSSLRTFCCRHVVEGSSTYAWCVPGGEKELLAPGDELGPFSDTSG